jgi:hypothetical protein
MRYIEGKDLRALISERGHLSSASALKIVEEVASALDAAHSLGVIHRDVKPANILIQGRDEEAYLTDFGVAKSLSSGGLTRTGTFLGTVDYCAPEQISGKPIDQRVDVYSLGGVLYHCLAGQPPYIRETEAAVINAHVSERPPAISGIRPDLPASLDGVIATAMAKEREVRYGSAGELASALRAALSEDASPEGRATVVEQAPSATAPQRPPLPETVVEKAAPPAGAAAPFRTLSIRVKDLLVILVSVALVLAAGAALAIALLRGGGKSGSAQKTQTSAPAAVSTAISTTTVEKSVTVPLQKTLQSVALAGLMEGPLPDDPPSEGRCFGAYEPAAYLELDGVKHYTNFVACGDYGSRSPSRASGTFTFRYANLPNDAVANRFWAMAGVDESSSSSQYGASVTWTVLYDGVAVCSRHVVWLGGRSRPTKIDCALPQSTASTSAVEIQQSVALASHGDFWAGLYQPTLIVSERAS